MMDKVNQRIAALQPYKPGKPIDELARELGINDIVKLASNENPLGLIQHVTDAISEASTQLPRYPMAVVTNSSRRWLTSYKSIPRKSLWAMAQMMC